MSLGGETSVYLRFSGIKKENAIKRKRNTRGGLKGFERVEGAVTVVCE